MENFRLKVFRAVARHQNFRIAAEELLLTQPAVTQQIKALESELDASLFTRTAGRVALTAAGAALLPFADRLAALAHEAREAVSAVSNTSAGTLALAASQTIGQYLLPRLIAGFLAENPKVEVSIRSGNTHDVLEALAAQKVALALIEGPPQRQDVRVEPFMEDHMVCIVPAAHEWAGESITLEQLARASFVSRELGSGSRRVIEQGLEQAGIRIRDLHVAMTFDTTEGVLSAVEAGLGVAFVSRWAVRPQLALGTLQIVRIQGLRLMRTFSLVSLAGPAPGGVTGAFQRFVLAQAEALVPRNTGRAKPRST